MLALLLGKCERLLLQQHGQGMGQANKQSFAICLFCAVCSNLLGKFGIQRCRIGISRP